MTTATSQLWPGLSLRQMTVRTMKRYRWMAIAQLTLALIIILGGAFVRATASGAGCGEHWPLCNGVPIPVNPTLKTLIEFSHRLSSSLLGFLSLAQWLWARRLFSKGETVRNYAGWCFVFVCLEGLIGAYIVKMGLVANNSSGSRAFWVAGHLVNTLFLVAIMAHHLWQIALPNVLERRAAVPAKVKMAVRASLWLIAIVAASGAVVALGDTLFPATSLVKGFMEKFEPGAHFLVKLRLYHPLLAMGTAAVIVYAAMQALALQRPALRGIAAVCMSVVGLQLLVGLSNLILLVPIPLQLLHLLVANALWLAVWRLRFQLTHSAMV